MRSEGGSSGIVVEARVLHCIQEQTTAMTSMRASERAMTRRQIRSETLSIAWYDVNKRHRASHIPPCLDGRHAVVWHGIDTPIPTVRGLEVTTREIALHRVVSRAQAQPSPSIICCCCDNDLSLTKPPCTGRHQPLGYSIPRLPWVATPQHTSYPTSVATSSPPSVQLLSACGMSACVFLPLSMLTSANRPPSLGSPKSRQR